MTALSMETDNNYLMPDLGCTQNDPRVFSY